MKQLLPEVEFRKQDPGTQHVAVCWKKGLPKDRDECWFLMTDLPYKAPKLTALDGQPDDVVQQQPPATQHHGPQ